MAESPNIAFKQPVGRRKYSSLPQYDIQHNRAPEKPEQNLSKKQYAPSTLEVYEASGDIRSEQPTALGNNIDIVV